MFMTGVLCTVCGAQVYFLYWPRKASENLKKNVINYICIYQSEFQTANFET